MDSGLMETQSSSGPVDETFALGMIERAAAAMNSHDGATFVSLMTEDVVFEHSASPTVLHGRDEVKAFYQDTVWRAFPDLTIELAEGPFFHPRESRISLAWRATATHTGPFDPPGLAPTGRPITMDVREILEIRDGLAHHVRLVADLADVMRQLGVLPAPGSRGERAMATMQRLQVRLTPRGRGPART
jgi:predicted ester cyclase